MKKTGGGRRGEQEEEKGDELFLDLAAGFVPGYIHCICKDVLQFIRYSRI